MIVMLHNKGALVIELARAHSSAVCLFWILEANAVDEFSGLLQVVGGGNSKFCSWLS